MRLGLGISIPGTSGLVQAFSPLDLSPVLWLDASDTSTITEVGGAVSQWDDKSGNGNDVTQGTAAAQPTSGTRTLNGLNVLDFDGNDLLQSGNFSSALTARTIFGVAVSDQTASIAYVVDGNVLNNRSAVGISGAGYRLYQGIGINAGTSDTSSHIYRAVFDATDTLHIDGVSTISGDAGSESMTGATIGAAPSGVLPWDGTIAEVIVIDGTLTAGEISLTESYLANKWGITL